MFSCTSLSKPWVFHSIGMKTNRQQVPPFFVDKASLPNKTLSHWVTMALLLSTRATSPWGPLWFEVGPSSCRSRYSENNSPSSCSWPGSSVWQCAVTKGILIGEGVLVTHRNIWTKFLGWVKKLLRKQNCMILHEQSLFPSIRQFVFSQSGGIDMSTAPSKSHCHHHCSHGFQALHEIKGLKPRWTHQPTKGHPSKLR